MKFGMTAEQYQILQKLIIQPLINQNARVYIFGSRAVAKQHPHSDVDILFKLESKTLPAGFLSQIVENIEESRFPFIVEVVNDDELAASYREGVYASRVEVF